MDSRIDFSNCELSGKYYGGSEKKEGILFQEQPYMLKFMKKNIYGDCFNDVAEYIVSHYFAKLGISSQSTLLGIYKGEKVVACKDFVINGYKFMPFNDIYNDYNDIIFENAQGLGLDINCGSEWHTTSNTGLTNPIEMLKDKEDFNAEVCYVTRAYITRHGIGPMGNEAYKKDINADMVDKTNVPNEFQGSLRYGYPENNEQKIRIWKDWSIVQNDSKYTKTLAITHCNEFPETLPVADYISYNPYSVIK